MVAGQMLHQGIPRRSIDRKNNRPLVVTTNTRRLLWLSCLICFCAPLSVQGTTVALLIGEKVAVVAADSASLGIARSGKMESVKTCKVKVVNGKLFTASGVLRDVVTGYDIFDLASSSSSVPSTSRWAADALKESIMKRLPPIIRRLMTKFSSDLSKRLLYGSPFISFVFVGVEKGLVRAYACQFVLGADGKTITPSCDLRSPGTIEVLGHKSAARVLIAANRSLLPGIIRGPIPGRVAFVASLVEKEVEAARLQDRPDVAAPVASATFDASGLHWISRGACEDQE